MSSQVRDGRQTVKTGRLSCNRRQKALVIGDARLCDIIACVTLNIHLEKREIEVGGFSQD
jgi:hypothetical protein